MATYSITISSAKIPSAQTDFPLYIDLGDLPAAFWQDVAAAGSNIRCYQADGTTPLAREVVAVNTAAKTGELYVKTNLSASSDTVIIISTDGTGGEPAATSTYGRNNVWTNGFGAVWHLSEAGEAITDSTGNGNDGVNEGMWQDPGKLGSGRSSDGSTNYNRIAINPTMPSLAFGHNDDMTMTAWVKPNQWAGRSEIIGSRRADSLGFGINNNGTIEGQFDDIFPTSSGTVTWGQWNHIAVVHNGDPSASTADFFIDGVASGSGSSRDANGWATLGYLYIGHETRGNSRLNGTVDEIRLARAKRSSSWLSIEYANQNNPAAFYSIAEIISSVDVDDQRSATIKGISPASNTRSAELQGAAQITDTRLVELSGVEAPVMATSLYYFDGSQGISDPDNAWVDDANAFDGNLSTVATASNPPINNNPPPLTSYLEGVGTNSPTVGGTITSVQARFRGFGTSDIGSTRPAVSIMHGSELLVDIDLGDSSGSLIYSTWVGVSTPSGGWTWAIVNGLRALCYIETSSGINAGVAYIELEITYEPGTIEDDYRRLQLIGADTTHSSRGIELQGADTLTNTRGVEVSGVENTSDSRAAQLAGVTSTGNARGVELVGSTTNFDTRPVEISGAEVLTDQRNVELSGVDTGGDVRSLELSGVDIAGDTRVVELFGEAQSENSRNTETHGSLDIDSVRDVEISGIDTDASAISAEIVGFGGNASGRNAQLTGMDSDTSDRVVEVSGSVNLVSGRSAEMSGVTSVQSDRSVQVSGTDTISDIRLAELVGSLSDADSRSAEVIGIDNQSTQRHVEVTGYLGRIDTRGAELVGGIVDYRNVELIGVLDIEDKLSVAVVDNVPALGIIDVGDSTNITDQHHSVVTNTQDVVVDFVDNTTTSTVVDPAGNLVINDDQHTSSVSDTVISANINDDSVSSNVTPEQNQIGVVDNISNANID